MKRRNWTRDELKEALNLYCLTPFGRIHSRNPQIIELGREIGRTPGAVALKMVNFASLDPTIKQKGMSNASALDAEVWREFFGDLTRFESDANQTPAYGFAEDYENEASFEDRQGLDAAVYSTRRINQDFFRKLVLASYDMQCAATGVNASELLVAGHIVPWSHSPALRTNPRNGICLNYLFDRAFDRGLITVDSDLSIRYSSRLPEKSVDKLVRMSMGKLRLPSRFHPEPSYFEYHRQNIFQN